MAKKKVSGSSKSKGKNSSFRKVVESSESKISKTAKPSSSSNVGAHLLDISSGDKSQARSEDSIGSSNADHVPKIDTSTAERILNPGSKSSGSDPEWLRTFSMSIFSLIVLFWIIVLALSITITPGPSIIERNVTLISYSPLKTSIEHLTNITNPNHDEKTTILAYLREERRVNDIGETVTRYAVDDYGNKIRVISLGYNNLFAQNSKITYNLTGSYHNTLNGFVFDATNITPQNRPLAEVKTQALENVSDGSKAGIKINLADGWEKIFAIVS